MDPWTIIGWAVAIPVVIAEFIVIALLVAYGTLWVWTRGGRR